MKLKLSCMYHSFRFNQNLLHLTVSGWPRLNFLITHTCLYRKAHLPYCLFFLIHPSGFPDTCQANRSPSPDCSACRSGKPVSPFHSVCNGWFLRHAGLSVRQQSGSKYFRHVVYFLDCQCRVEIRSGSASTGAISSSRSSSVSPLFSCSTSSEPISSSSSNGIFSIGSERVGVILATFGSSR